MLKAASKRARKPKFAVLEEALGLWFANMQAKKAIITDVILIQKAKQYAEASIVRIFHHQAVG